jgi:NADP-dependent 3-hydroxy acid dehydrogenase YdfG
LPETVVITGASAGVGRATAHAFAAQGAQIGLIARGTQGLQAAAAAQYPAIQLGAQ